MHFLILGGNGRTGSVVVAEALSRGKLPRVASRIEPEQQAHTLANVGHTVTVLVRDPTKVTPKTGLTTSKGTPTSLNDMQKAFSARKPDVVIVTLNAPRATESPFAKSISPPRLMADSVANAVTTMKEFDVTRITVMQAWGVGSSFKNLNFLMRWTIAKSEMCKLIPSVLPLRRYGTLSAQHANTP